MHGRRPEETSSLRVSGVETVLWSTAAKKAEKWRLGVLEAAERIMVKRHGDEAELGRRRRVSAVGGVEGKRGRGRQQEE